MTDYVLPSSDSESVRLERQARLYGGASFLDPFLAEGPGDVLDVGCGTGHFTRYAAERLPAARVIGVDVDDARLAFARARAGVGTPNARFDMTDLQALPFEDERFDLAFCRMVLIHVAEPTRVLVEMARVLRPGGRVVALDCVHDGIWFSPAKPAFARLLRQVIDHMRERGLEPNQGLHLGPAMIRAGLEHVTVQVIPHAALAPEPALETYRQNWIETIAGLDEVLGARFDAGVVASAREELERRTGDELLVELTVLAHGRKPAPAPRRPEVHTETPG